MRMISIYDDLTLYFDEKRNLQYINLNELFSRYNDLISKPYPSIHPVRSFVLFRFAVSKQAYLPYLLTYGT